MAPVSQELEPPAARLEELKQTKVTWTELYQGLSDSQKKEADEIVLPMMGMGGPGAP